MPCDNFIGEKTLKWSKILALFCLGFVAIMAVINLCDLYNSTGKAADQWHEILTFVVGGVGMCSLLVSFFSHNEGGANQMPGPKPSIRALIIFCLLMGLGLFLANGVEMFAPVPNTYENMEFEELAKRGLGEPDLVNARGDGILSDKVSEWNTAEFGTRITELTADIETLDSIPDTPTGTVEEFLEKYTFDDVEQFLDETPKQKYNEILVLNKLNEFDAAINLELEEARVVQVKASNIEDTFKNAAKAEALNQIDVSELGKAGTTQIDIKGLGSESKNALPFTTGIFDLKAEINEIANPAENPAYEAIKGFNKAGMLDLEKVDLQSLVDKVDAVHTTLEGTDGLRTKIAKDVNFDNAKAIKADVTTLYDQYKALNSTLDELRSKDLYSLNDLFDDLKQKHVELQAELTNMKALEAMKVVEDAKAAGLLEEGEAANHRREKNGSIGYRTGMGATVVAMLAGYRWRDPIRNFIGCPENPIPENDENRDDGDEHQPLQNGNNDAQQNGGGDGNGNGRPAIVDRRRLLSKAERVVKAQKRPNSSEIVLPHLA